MSAMDRIRGLLSRRQSYEPIEGGSDVSSSQTSPSDGRRRFSWVEYGIFMLLGVAMLWAWNMFLAAGPYFQRRFAGSEALLDNFQAAELLVSTLANLSSMIVLSKLQVNASYPRRIISSLILAATIFTLLSISTKIKVPAGLYFAFLIAMVLFSSLATGLIQNGVFSYVSAYGRSDYVQAIMTGQGIAGVLPPVAQIITVLAANGNDAGQNSSTSAMTYFLTATGVASLTLSAFLFLKYNYPPPLPEPHDTVADINGHDTEQHSDDDIVNTSSSEKQVPLLRLAWKLRYSAAAVFVTFGLTMMFPVFTQEIISTNPDPSPLFQKAAFIPLAFLVWNLGDLVGRVVPLIQRLSLTSYPKVLLILAILRVVWVPLYLMCNIQPAEVSVSAPDLLPTVKSDAFYLVIVQFLFGLTNGYLGGNCMMGFALFVAESEREAAGGFMGLMLVGGLSVGSIFSFLVGNKA